MEDTNVYFQEAIIAVHNLQKIAENQRLKLLEHEHEEMQNEIEVLKRFLDSVKNAKQNSDQQNNGCEQSTASALDSNQDTVIVDHSEATLKDSTQSKSIQTEHKLIEREITENMIEATEKENLMLKCEACESAQKIICKLMHDLQIISTQTDIEKEKGYKEVIDTACGTKLDGCIIETAPNEVNQTLKELVRLIVNYDNLAAESKTESLVLGLLCEAIQNDNKNIVKLLLLNGAKINVNQKDKCSSLIHSATAKGDIEIIEMLLDRGADVNAKNKNGDSLLCSAICTKRIDIVKLLLDKGVNVNTKDIFGSSPLDLAIRLGITKIIEMLLDKGADIDNKDSEPPLCKAIRNNRKDIVKLLLDKGANVNIGNIFGMTPLHLAIERGIIEIIEMLLHNGADINVNKGSDTPLCLAIRGNRIDIVKLLLDNGANINMKEKFGRTPVHLAVLLGIIEIVQLLLERDADVNAEDEGGDTPLSLAICQKKVEIAKLLLDKGAGINRNKLTNTI